MPPELLTQAMAAVLHLRGDGLIAGAEAVWLWDAHNEQPEQIDVILVGRNTGPMPGVTLHRVPDLDPRDVRWRKGLPVTSPARSLLDFAATADPLEVESALALLRRHHQLRDREIENTMARLPTNHAGVPVIRKLLGRPAQTLAALRSRYERKLFDLILAARLQGPVTNQMIEGHEADIVFTRQKLIVEFDGWEFHKEKFRSDRRRDNHHIAHGWTVLRFTADRIDQEPYAVIAEIAAALTIAEHRLGLAA